MLHALKDTFFKKFVSFFGLQHCKYCQGIISFIAALYSLKYLTSFKMGDSIFISMVERKSRSASDYTCAEKAI